MRSLWPAYQRIDSGAKIIRLCERWHPHGPSGGYPASPASEGERPSLGRYRATVLAGRHPAGVAGRPAPPQVGHALAYPKGTPGGPTATGPPATRPKPVRTPQEARLRVRMVRCVRARKQWNCTSQSYIGFDLILGEESWSGRGAVLVHRHDVAGQVAADRVGHHADDRTPVAGPADPLPAGWKPVGDSLLPTGWGDRPFL